MADQKITQLAEETNPATSDIVVIIKDPGGTPASRKATILNLIKNIKAEDLNNVTIQTENKVDNARLLWSTSSSQLLLDAIERPSLKALTEKVGGGFEPDLSLANMFTFTISNADTVVHNPINKSGASDGVTYTLRVYANDSGASLDFDTDYKFGTFEGNSIVVDNGKYTYINFKYHENSGKLHFVGLGGPI